ncbi:putative phage protein (TIGR01671 family) [Paenibacillus sp. 1182]|uniref:YopX family protein n=1 Tax=Paenibacillus sp. 1182 TaxID=2806565 RepID=UPI001AE93797|nr:YopX family protein [Paenibacillus sp. 1182]MBP1312298.1 putative phage protein (TIGR01671 family) [Paenibacillus sp. 1182]
MSRPIKFRAWDVFAKEMDYEVTIDPEGKVAAFNPLDGQYVRGFSDDEKVLMQYTGLKDRNGKEIYEGDILTWQDHKHLWSTADDSFTAKATVEFDLVELKYMVGHLSLSAKREFEVIGNIYETPLEDTP